MPGFPPKDLLVAWHRNGGKYDKPVLGWCLMRKKTVVRIQSELIVKKSMIIVTYGFLQGVIRVNTLIYFVAMV